MAQDLDNSFDNWTGDTLKTCSDLAYMLTLNNQSDHNIEYKVKFKLVDPNQVPNLRWPINGVRGLMAAQTHDNVVLLQKIIPTEGVDGE